MRLAIGLLSHIYACKQPQPKIRPTCKDLEDFYESKPNLLRSHGRPPPLASVGAAPAADSHNHRCHWEPKSARAAGSTGGRRLLGTLPAAATREAGRR
ncbi:Os05g0184132 [Oryza sativa Japonica Group]|uniref:Os05g0184132 protein n=1 Tax=Oryza sativa subsp. japonica TaxID=39947 RepID=A0A0P0WIP5_ORYSJ|nr:Os05g0184132 [Oryza sativa Japonica Group]